MTVVERYKENAATTAVLMNAGIELMRQNIKRANPTVSDGEVEELLSSWLWRTADPVPGDTAGQVRVREMKT
jgi:hypothetical protein